MSKAALEQKEKTVEPEVETRTFQDFSPGSSSRQRVEVEVTESRVTRRIKHRSEGKKIEIENEEDSDTRSFPTKLESYSRLSEDVEKVKLEVPQPEIVEEGINTYNFFTGYIFVQPQVEIQAGEGELTPMKPEETSRAESETIKVPDTDLHEPGTGESTRPGELVDQEAGSYTDPDTDEYYPEPERETYILLENPAGGTDYVSLTEDSLPINSVPELLDFPGTRVELSENSVAVDYDSAENEKDVSREQRIQVGEEMIADEGTVKEAIEHLIESGELDGAVLETPYYSEKGGENFDRGWNTHPQIVELEGFDMDTAEYRINGELAKDDIGSAEIEAGDTIEIQEAEFYGSHGEYEASDETREAWTERYGEHIWDEEWDDIDRHIYAALEEGNELTGQVDLSEREYIREVLEDGSYDLSRNLSAVSPEPSISSDGESYSTEKMLA